MPASDVLDASIRINDTRLPPEAWSDVRSLSVQEDLDAISMFALELYNWDDRLLTFPWSESPLFAVGNEVEISLGYVDDLHPVMVAEIISLEPRFASGELPMLTVRGYDHRHRLARGRKTRVFQQMADSAIAEQVAREAGLSSAVTETDIKHSYVLQSNQSDLDFLQQRARRIGYEVFARDKVLYFRPPQHTAAPTVTLELGEEITEFSPRLSSQSQVGELAVRGWDVKQKQVIVGKATVGQETTTGGGSSGPRAARQAFGGSSTASVDLPVHTVAEADAIARGRFDDIALDFVRGDVVADGQPQVHAGTVVTIDGVGDRFSGPYYVTSVTHSLTAEQGYQTTLSVQRNNA
jgi:phage protein D